ncbi:MAG: transcription antitermination factor NusB [Bryobacterales bacterium]|nr:transcription antitermination factor NusB [Bryobacterales bacterium]
MPARYKSRQRALQVLFQCDIRSIQAHEGVRAYYDSLYLEEGDELPEQDSFMEALVEGTQESLAACDELIGKHSANWRIERMPLVDRNILRLGIHEMLGLGTPPAVVIDQAIALARRFSGEESVPFINGVLDAVRREQLTNQREAPRQAAGED